jgi:hypothetical protein
MLFNYWYANRSILEDSSALDQSGRFYYCTIGDMDNNNLLLTVNLAAGSYNATVIKSKALLSPATWSAGLGCFLGIPYHKANL